MRADREFAAFIQRVDHVIGHKLPVRSGLHCGHSLRLPKSRMVKCLFLFVALLASSCGPVSHGEDSRSKAQPPLLVAATSVSLEFPLQFDADDAPPGYIKVGSDEGRNESPERLISALVLCSPDLAWFEKTSHSMAVIMPAAENAIWSGFKGERPSDSDLIECIRESAGQPFFYRKLPNGIETYRQN